MRVLHVYKDYPPVHGGIERQIALLAEAQARAGAEVRVLVTHPRLRTRVVEERGVEVIRAGRLATIASTPLSPTFLGWLRRLPTDVLHVHAPYPPGELGVLLSRRRATVVSYQSDIVRQRLLGRLYRPLQHRILTRADRILLSSPRYLAASRTLAPHAARCRVAPPGIDAEPFLAADPEAAAAHRARYGTPVVLFVGRLRWYKGVEHLIAAMARLDQGTLVVAGSGPMEARWRRLAGEHLATGRCHFLGAVPDSLLPSLYAAADVAVLPSITRAEAFGVVQLEAMAAAVPVISTELGTGTSWVNVHRETGLVVAPGDPEDLAAAIRELLDDPQLRRRLGEAGRRRVLAEFTTDHLARRVLSTYDEILAERLPL